MTNSKWESTQRLIAKSRSDLRPYDAMQETHVFIPDSFIWDSIDEAINLIHLPIHLASQ